MIAYTTMMASNKTLTTDLILSAIVSRNYNSSSNSGPASARARMLLADVATCDTPSDEDDF